MTKFNGLIITCIAVLMLASPAMAGGNKARTAQQPQTVEAPPTQTAEEKNWTATVRALVAYRIVRQCYEAREGYALTDINAFEFARATDAIRAIGERAEKLGVDKNRAWQLALQVSDDMAMIKCRASLYLLQDMSPASFSNNSNPLK